MIGNCPKCKEAIRIPAGEPDQEVRCPLCNSEYQLQDVFDRLPPMLELVGKGGGAENVSVGIQIDDGFSDLEIKNAGSKSQSPSTYQRQRRPERSAFKEILKVIGGGVVAIPIGILCVWWFAGRDPFDLSEKVSQYAPWIVPEKLRGGDQVDDSVVSPDKKPVNAKTQKLDQPKRANSELFLPEPKSNAPDKKVNGRPIKNLDPSKESASKQSAGLPKTVEPASTIKPEPPTPEPAVQKTNNQGPSKSAPPKSENEKTLDDIEKNLPSDISEDDRKKAVTWLRSLPMMRIGPIAFSKAPSPAMTIEINKAIDFDLGGWVAKGKDEAATEQVLLEILESNDSNFEMDRVLFAIGWIGTEQSVPVLLNCLNRGDAEFQNNVIAVLCEIPDETAVQQLGSRLQIAIDGPYGLAGSIITVLKDIGTEDAMKFLSAAVDAADEELGEFATEEYERTTPRPTRSTEFGGFF